MFTRTFKSKGFTLIEMLVAISIGIVGATLLLMAATNGLRYAREIREKQKLQSEAEYLINKLAQSIRISKEIEVVSASKLKLKTSTGERTFEQDGNKIIYNGVQINAADTLVTNLNFLPKKNALKVAMTLQGKESQVSFKTTLAQRN